MHCTSLIEWFAPMFKVSCNRLISAVFKSYWQHTLSCLTSVSDSCTITGLWRQVAVAFWLQLLNEPSDQSTAGPLPGPPLEDYCSGTSCSIGTKSATYCSCSHQQNPLLIQGSQKSRNHANKQSPHLQHTCKMNIITFKYSLNMFPLMYSCKVHLGFFNLLGVTDV